MKYYSYDPNGNGIQFHETEDEAQRVCEDALDYERHHAADSDWNWHDNIDEISWGIVRGQVEVKDRNLTPEEKSENPEWDYIREVDLVESEASK